MGRTALIDAEGTQPFHPYRMMSHNPGFPGEEPKNFHSSLLLSKKDFGSIYPRPAIIKTITHQSPVISQSLYIFNAKKVTFISQLDRISYGSSTSEIYSKKLICCAHTIQNEKKKQ